MRYLCCCSNMAKHMNAFQGLIIQATSLEVPLANEVLVLLLLGSLTDSWETLVVTLGNVGPEGKHLSLARVKSSFAKWRGVSERQGCDLPLQSSHYRLKGTTRKTAELESLEPRKVGDKVKIKGEAHILLMWEAGALLKELSAFPRRERNRQYRLKEKLWPEGNVGNH